MYVVTVVAIDYCYCIIIISDKRVGVGGSDSVGDFLTARRRAVVSTPPAPMSSPVT